MEDGKLSSRRIIEGIKLSWRLCGIVRDHGRMVL